MADPTDKPFEVFPNIRPEITARLNAWLLRNEKRVRDESGYASIKFTLMNPGGDDDNTLVVEVKVEEEFLQDTFEARSEGVPFDTTKRVG